MIERPASFVIATALLSASPALAATPAGPASPAVPQCELSPVAFPYLVRPNTDALLQQAAFPVAGRAPETGPFVLGARAYRDKDYAEAVRQWTTATAQGSAKAMYFLAGMYFDGKGVERDSARGIALYRQAAEAGDTAPLSAPLGSSISNQAMIRLALIYDAGVPAGPEDLKVGTSGLGGYWDPAACIRDRSEAANWYRRWAGTIDPSTPYARRAKSVLQSLQIQP